MSIFIGFTWKSSFDNSNPDSLSFSMLMLNAIGCQVPVVTALTTPYVNIGLELKDLREKDIPLLCFLFDFDEIWYEG